MLPRGELLFNVRRNELYKRMYSTYVEFTDVVSDLLESDVVQSMQEFNHHSHVTTLEHSQHVSYYSFVLAKRLKLDSVSAARGAMLHDLFLYDWHEKQDPKLVHTFGHPKIALANAEEHFELNEIEREMILMHMWPMVDTPGLPKHKETYLLAAVDKFCAVGETARFDVKLLERRFRKIALGNALLDGIALPASVTARARV